MRGVDVLVRRPVAVGSVTTRDATTMTTTTTTDETPFEPAYDELGRPVFEWSKPETVGDVLVSVGAAADSLDSNRPDGVTVTYTLVWPKSDVSSLRGCEVKVPGDGEWYRVIGDPRPQLDGQMRRPYNRRNRVVEIGRDDG